MFNQKMHLTTESTEKYIENKRRKNILAISSVHFFIQR